MADPLELVTTAAWGGESGALEAGSARRRMQRVCGGHGRVAWRIAATVSEHGGEVVVASPAAHRRGMEDVATMEAYPRRIREAVEAAAAGGCDRRRADGAMAAQCGNGDPARSGGRLGKSARGGCASAKARGAHDQPVAAVGAVSRHRVSGGSVQSKEAT
ncbi:hypothetical protein SEVIR_1G093550v4 [Setaria viridis]